MDTPKFSSLHHSNDHPIHACPGYLFASEHTAQDSFSYDSSNNPAETGRKRNKIVSADEAAHKTNLKESYDGTNTVQSPERTIFIYGCRWIRCSGRACTGSAFFVESCHRSSVEAA
jgi:hypothetical protein